MTVKTLIAALLALPADKPVFICDVRYQRYLDIEDVKISDSDVTSSQSGTIVLLIGSYS